jgi:hypothetical protein
MKKPNFFIIGAPKSGTTSLSVYLSEHPKIFFSNPREPQYFCTDFSEKWRPVVKKEEYLKIFSESSKHSIVGEGSTQYLRSEIAVTNILKFNPDAKFIVMIRNPIEMFSSWHSHLLNTLDEYIEDPKKAWDLQEERKEGRYIAKECRDPNFLQYGDFCKIGKQVYKFLNNVPNKENIRIVKFECFKNNTRRVYEEVLKFLKTDSDYRETFPIYAKNKELKYRNLSKILKSIKNSPIKNISEFIKKKLGIKSYTFINILSHKCNAKINKKRKPLDDNFRKELENYFQEDQNLLSEIINNNKNIII